MASDRTVDAAREKLARELSQPGREVVYEETVSFGAGAVARYRLANGLRILLLVDKSAPVVAYHTWFGVGSRHEKQGKTGLAHLFEHLMFNETESLKAGEFDRKLEENGAESNAATWLDWTMYHESLPADRFALAVKLEADRMAHLVLRTPQVTSEKEVVANERRYRVDDDVEGTASELLYKTAFTKHPYHWPTIGWMEDIQSFTPEDCEAFYRTYYAPNNACVVVVGDVREKDAIARIRDAYGPIPGASIPAEDYHPEPPQLEPRTVEIEKPTASEKLFIGYHGPALGDADHAPLTVLSEVLFAGRASRVHRALVQGAELATDVRGWVSTFRDPGLFEMHVTARPGISSQDVLAALDRELDKVRMAVVTEDELARAKARLELSLLQSLETASGKAETIGFYETVMGEPAAAFRRLGEYRRVTASEVRAAARRVLRDEGRTIVRVVPERAAPSAPATEAAS